MFGLGGQELVLIVFLAVLLFGSKKLPELAKGMGSSINEFKKALNVEEAEKQINSIKEDIMKPADKVVESTPVIK